MLQEALNLYDSGWCVLPVVPHEKRPYLQNWKDYTKERPPKDGVISWFTNLQNVGLGVATGKVSNIAVLDVECDCPIPIEDLIKKYPTNLITRTGSGGYHLFYSYPYNVPTIKNRVGIIDRVDLRADGGFIVLPPTMHTSGNRYEWVSQGLPGAFPTEILQVESEGKSSEKWLSDALKGVSKGGRNDTAARIAGYFFKKGIPEDIIETQMLMWNESNNPPLPIQEIYTVIRSIKSNHSSTPGVSTQINMLEEKKPEKFEFLSYRDYITGYSGGTDWLIDKWLPEKSIIFMIAPPESYKTWLLLDAAISIASGGKFLGQFETNAKGPVMIIQQEDSHGGLTERMSLIEESKFNALPKIGELEEDENLIAETPDLDIYIHPNRQLNFGNKQVLEDLEEQIKEIKPLLVIIDPLYSATTADNFMSGAAEQMLILKRWRDQYGTSFLIAHHSKKNLEPGSTAREDLWGSQFLNAFSEGGWQIRRSKSAGPNEIVVRRHSKVMGNLAPISLNFDISTVYPLKYQVETGVYEGSTTPNVNPTHDRILDQLSQSFMSQGELALALGKDVTTISRSIKELLDKGLVEKMPGQGNKKGCKYVLVDPAEKEKEK